MDIIVLFCEIHDFFSRLREIEGPHNFTRDLLTTKLFSNSR